MPELVEAVRSGADPKQVKLLLQRNADPDSFSRDGMTALHVACLRNRYAHLELLLAAGADIELAARDGYQMRPIHLAIQSVQSVGGIGLPGVRLLLKKGASPNACRADHHRCVSLRLFRAGVELVGGHTWSACSQCRW